MASESFLEKPLVTVIIPSYQHAKYVCAAVQSVLAQTHQQLQVIVIDDGSRDESPQLLKQFEPDVRVKLVLNSNQGVCRTLNQGIELASGDYIAFLASDDLYAPNKIEKQLEVFSRDSETGMVYSQARSFGEEDKVFPRRVISGHIFDNLMHSNFIPGSSVMISRKVIEEVGSFDVSLKVEDWDYWLRVAKKWKVAGIAEPLISYRVHGQNTTSPAKALAYTESVIQIVRKHSEKDPSAQIRDIAYRACARYASSREIGVKDVWGAYLRIRREHGFSLMGVARIALRFLLKK